MKTLGKMVALLVVLGFCLPTYGDILVYKLMVNATHYFQDGGEWQIDPDQSKGYLVVDVDYGSGTITQAETMSYERDADGKWYEHDSPDLELVRVEYGTRVQWVIMEKRIELDGEEITGGAFYMLTGSARARSIGAAERREVPNKLSGYGLDDDAGDGQREIIKATLSGTLYPTFTYWANGTDVGEGNQDFEAAKEHVKTYLETRGYVERP